MARVKQTTLLRGDPSSEYTSKQDRTPRNTEQSNETIGHTNGSLLKALDLRSNQEAGLVQLLFAVGGIYGSF